MRRKQKAPPKVTRVSKTELGTFWQITWPHGYGLGTYYFTTNDAHEIIAIVTAVHRRPPSDTRAAKLRPLIAAALANALDAPSA